MAEFYTILDKLNIANQIADMINKYNRWYVNFSGQSILKSTAHYFIELMGDKVVCCAGIEQETDQLSKIMHICTLPEYRGIGLAKKVLSTTIKSAKTDYVYMTIREDNTQSIALANSFRFRYVNKHLFIDHYTLTFGRKKNDA